MRVLVAISGKGGTGKTSIVASFAALANECALAEANADQTKGGEQRCLFSSTGVSSAGM